MTTFSASARGKRRAGVPDLRRKRLSEIGYFCEVRNGDATSVLSDASSYGNESEDKIIRTKTEITVVRGN